MRRRRRRTNKIRKLVNLILIISFLIGIILIKYPPAYKEEIVRSSKEFGVDPFLIASIINVESKYDKMAKSNKDAMGLMQIRETTGDWASREIGLEFSKEDLYRPDINIRLGSWYINKLFEEFDGNLDLVLAAYNAGSGNVNKWLSEKDYCSDGQVLDKIPFRETEDYLTRVKSNYKVYTRLYRESLTNGERDFSRPMEYIHSIKKGIKKFLSK